MSGAQSEVNFDMAELVIQLDQLGQSFENADLNVLASDLLTALDDLVQSEGALSSDGEEWDPLSPNTLKRHPRRVGGSILQATGLLASFQPFVEQGAFGAESPAHYSGFHVTGTVNMPRRDPTDIDMDAFLELIADSLGEQVTG